MYLVCTNYLDVMEYLVSVSSSQKPLPTNRIQPILHRMHWKKFTFILVKCCKFLTSFTWMRCLQCLILVCLHLYNRREKQSTHCSVWVCAGGGWWGWLTVEVSSWKGSRFRGKGLYEQPRPSSTSTPVKWIPLNERLLSSGSYFMVTLCLSVSNYTNKINI